jgi:flagellar hook-length control protein FliK
MVSLVALNSSPAGSSANGESRLAAEPRVAANAPLDSSVNNGPASKASAGKGPTSKEPEKNSQAGNDPVIDSDQTDAAPDFQLPAEAGSPAETQWDASRLADPAGVNELPGWDGAAENPPDSESTPADTGTAALPEMTAEQWLLSMLGQQTVQIEARDNVGTNDAGLDEGAPVIGAQRLSRDRAGLPPEGGDAGQTGIQQERGQALGQSDRAADLASSSQVFKDVHTARIDGFDKNGVARLSAAEALINSEPVAQLSAPAGLAAAPAAGSNATATSINHNPQAPTLERSLTLHGPEAKWGEQLLHALRDNVALQVQKQIQSATIRLDPPELGSMEIFLSHESGRLSVHISAAQSDVARLLQQTSERLRHELTGQSLMQVNVQVSTDGQAGQRHSQQGRGWLSGEESAVADNQQASVPAQDKTARRSDILVTV